jgi:hypothetical protein
LQTLKRGRRRGGSYIFEEQLGIFEEQLGISGE